MSRLYGFTLIEVMVVTVLMAMAASVVVVSLGAADQTSQMMSIVAQAKEFDIRGRLLAQTLGQATAIMLEEDRLILATDPFQEQSPLVSELPLDGSKIQLETDRPVQRVIFDRFGQSDDYTVTVTCNDRSRRFTVRGLSRSILQQEASP